MRRFRRLVLVFFLFALASLLAGERGARSQVVGGTLPALHAKTTVRVDLTDNNALLLWFSKTEEVRIPYAKVNALEYGQSVSRRYAEAVLISPMLLLSKSHKHFVTLGYVDAGGKEQSVVLRVEKGDIRAVLAGLEARTGRRVEFQDDDARKAER